MRFSCFLAHFFFQVLTVLVTAAASETVPLPYPDEPAPGTLIVHPVDDAIMVWIPSGYFSMGMDLHEADAAAKMLGYADWKEVWAWEWFPRRRVYLPGFFIDRTPVTRDLWERFLTDSGYEPLLANSLPTDQQERYAMYPVVNVHWSESRRYVNWAGKQLPSEAQWEKAARGVDARLFPWGNELPDESRGAFVNLETRQATHLRVAGAFARGASPYGVLDMAGNVYEWTSDWVEPYPNNPEHHRMLPYANHSFGALRGGSFYHGPHAYLTAKRFGFEPGETYYHVGFRPVWTPPDDYFTSEAFSDAKEGVSRRQAIIDHLLEKAHPTPLDQ